MVIRRRPECSHPAGPLTTVRCKGLRQFPSLRWACSALGTGRIDLTIWRRSRGVFHSQSRPYPERADISKITTLSTAAQYMLPPFPQGTSSSQEAAPHRPRVLQPGSRRLNDDDPRPDHLQIGDTCSAGTVDLPRCGACRRRASPLRRDSSNFFHKIHPCRSPGANQR